MKDFKSAETKDGKNYHLTSVQVHHKKFISYAYIARDLVRCNELYIDRTNKKIAKHFEL